MTTILWWFTLIFLLCLPFSNLLWNGFMRGGFAANPVEFVQLKTGWGATWIFLSLLYIAPLKLLFPQNPILKKVSRHKRLIGVGCFIYALFHLLIYLLDSGDFKTMLENLERPFILFGLGAFLILLTLAATSWNGAIKALGGRKWKQLHRFSYLAILLVFIHMLAKEKSNILVTLAYFLPLLGLELYRYWQFRRKK